MKRRAERRRGGVLVWVVASLGVVVAVLALGVDGGRLLEERRRARLTADAAALAAACVLAEKAPAGTGQNIYDRARERATALAAANGYNNDGVTNQLWIDIPPTTGPYAGKKDIIEVRLRSTLKGSFSASLTRGDLVVHARAVARGQSPPIGILTLRSNGNDALLISGNGTFKVKGTINVNSNDSVAYNVSGNAIVEADSHNVVGNIVVGSPSFKGTKNTGVNPLPDPYAALAEPTTTGLPVRSNSHLSISTPALTTLSPGVYRRGISIGGDGPIQMLPGLYIMDGGGFRVSGNGRIDGTGVTIFNAAGSGADQILFSGQSDVNLSPPTAGAYAGIVFFQARNVSHTLQISGNGIMNITGTVYAPQAPIQLSGNGVVEMKLGSAFVGRSMQVSGNGNILVDPESNASRHPPTLVE